MRVDPMPDTRFAGPPGMRAANADRDRAVDVLKAGFAEGTKLIAIFDPIRPGEDTAQLAPANEERVQ